MLLLSQEFEQKCANAAHEFLDTDVFIHAAYHQDFLAKLVELMTKNCIFVTTSSVVFEYTRGARSVDELSVRREFVKRAYRYVACC